MNKYELLVILSAQVDDEAKEAAIQKVTSILEKAGASIENIDKQGVKKFAYAINHKNEGVYVMYNLALEATALKDITKSLNITDGVVRTMFIKK